MLTCDYNGWNDAPEDEREWFDQHPEIWAIPAPEANADESARPPRPAGSPRSQHTTSGSAAVFIAFPFPDINETGQTCAKGERHPETWQPLATDKPWGMSSTWRICHAPSPSEAPIVVVGRPLRRTVHSHLMGRTRFVNAGCDTVNAYPEEVNGYLSAVNSCLVVAGPAIAVGESPQQVVMRSLQGGERTLRVGDLVPAGAAPSPGLAIPPPSSGDPAQAVAAHMTELR